ncbi:MAG: L-dopachrome tautomerase-related protein [Pseudomonadota bacterium]
MDIRILAAASACAALALASTASAAAATPPPKLEVLADIPAAPGNVTVAPDGLVVVSTHPSFAADVMGYRIDKGGAVMPFPAKELGTGMQRILSVRADDKGHVWMLAGTPGPAVKNLYVVDAKSGAIDRTIAIDAPGAFLNDMALALDKGVIVMSDPGGKCSLDILDLKTGVLRKVLVGDKSVVSEDIDAPIDGIPLAQSRSADGKLVPLRGGVNPITIDAREEWVYYGAMTSRSLYRVRLKDLLDAALSDQQLSAKVQRYGDKAPSAGITIDNAGNVYVTDVGARGIGVTSPDGQYRVLVQDNTLLDWPDGIAVGPGGYVYIAPNGLYRGWASHRSMGPAQPPFHLIRFKALAETTPGR